MKEHPYIRLGQSLARVPFLRHASEAEIDGILLDTVILECEPGDALIEEGAPGDDFYVLLKGKLRVTHGDTELAVLDDPGAIVGELALDSHELRSATVSAAERSFVLKVASNFMEKLSEEQEAAFKKELHRFVVEIQAERLAKLEGEPGESEGEG